MARLRYNGSGSGGSGGGGCPSVHEDLDSGDVIVHGTPVTDPGELAQLQHLDQGEVAVRLPRDVLVDFGPKPRAPKLVSVDEFLHLFETFEHTAWRLETRRRYASDEETDTWEQFAAGEPVQWDYDDDWCTNVRRQTGQGKRFERVRLVDDPPTTGQLYLLDNARRNCAAGEDIRNLPRAEADRLRLPPEDFWLFDSRLAALLNFDGEDNLLDVEMITEPMRVNCYAQIRDAAWHHAVAYDTFAAELPPGR
ncbi:DUF6879 family protein [Streptomyces phytophilus]|uniref:DUF6879 family protein n=1 Tax=Streptomyces phytophilus TaxID=722715 RepID=UPI0015F0AF71|nr:DUF6879 family protein [Streptomyces phytophilus]